MKQSLKLTHARAYSLPIVIPVDRALSSTPSEQLVQSWKARIVRDNPTMNPATVHKVALAIVYRPAYIFYMTAYHTAIADFGGAIMNNPTADQEINALIAFKSYRRQLFKVAFMRKMGKRGVILMREENHLMRLWAQVKPMTAVKTRPVYEYLNTHTPYDACRYVALKGRLPKFNNLPKDYQGWAVQ